MADYYELLGVDEDAQVDEIRVAYRDKKAAVTGDEKNKDTDASKAEVARLNKAWNVLSDPFQRGRYDIDRANRAESDEDEEDDDDATPVRRSASTAAAKSSSGKRQTSAERRAERANAKPTVTLPAGMHFPSTKRRLFAMGIDLLLLIVLFIGSQLLVVHLEKSNHRAAYDTVTTLNGSGDGSVAKAHSATSKAKKTASAAKDQYTELAQSKGKDDSDTQAALANANEKQAAADALQKTEDKLNDQLEAAQKQLAPTQNFVTAVYFLLALFILAIPSLFGGQTLGKRLQHVRLVRADGAPLAWTDVFRRYTALVFAAFALYFILRSPIGAVIVVFVATLWTRNPNQQALQDRFAKTLVLTDIEE